MKIIGKIIEYISSITIAILFIISEKIICKLIGIGAIIVILIKLYNLFFK